MAATETTPAQLVERLLNETKQGEDEHAKRVRRFNRSYDVYRATPEGDKDMEDWQCKLRVPYGMQVIDTAMVNMAIQKPRCRVLPRSPDEQERALAFQRVFDYYAARDHLAEKNALVVQPALIFGITVGKTHWLYREGLRTSRQPDGVVTAPVVEYDGPSFEPWDPYQAWWDPAGRDVDSCAWFALGSFLSKEDLLRNACSTPGSHAPEACDGLYHNVDELIATGAHKKPDPNAQNRFLTAEIPKDRYLIIEYWRDDRLTVVGNRKVLLRDVPNPHWHGRKPIVAACTRPDMFKIQGIPETELVDHLQQALWTVQRMRFDNLHLTVMRGGTYREGGITDPSKIAVRPRLWLPVGDHDDVQPFQFAPLPPEAYQEEAQLLGRLQYVTGITPYVSGANLETVDQSTATGVNLLTEVASRLLTFKARQVQLGVWQRVFEQWGSDIQQFIDKPLWVRIDGPGGEVSFQAVGPDEVAGEYDFVLQGTDEDLSRSKERSDAVSLVQALAPMIQAGIIDPKPLVERVGRAFGVDDPQTLLAAAQPQQQAAPGPPADQGGNGASTPVGPARLPGGRLIVGMPSQQILGGGGPG